MSELEKPAFEIGDSKETAALPTPEAPKGPEDSELTREVNRLKKQAGERRIELLNGLESIQQKFLHWGSEMPDYIKKFKKRVDSYSEKVKLAISMDEGKGLAGVEASMYSDAQKSIQKMDGMIQGIISLTGEGKEPTSDPDDPETYEALDLTLRGSFESRPHFAYAGSSDLFAVYDELNDSWEDLAKHELKKSTPK